MTIIPHEELQQETLARLIEEFVTREGAIQGHVDVSLEEKIRAVMQQLKSGKAQIVFDEESESCSIIVNDAKQEHGRTTDDSL